MPYDVIVGRNESDKKAFGKRGLAFIGKSYVKMGQFTSLSNPIYMDIARSHVILICGKRGSGKSYTIGSIAESLSNLNFEESKNISPIIFDTMGIFWTMKYKNEKEASLLSEWNYTSKNIPVRVFAPFGHFRDLKEKGIGVDKEFAIKVSELSPEDWISLFELNFTDGPAIAIESSINELKTSVSSFSFEDIFEKIISLKRIDENSKNAAISLFHAAKTWGVFDEKRGTEIKDLITAGETTVIDLSMYSSIGAFNIRALIIGLVSKKIFEKRLQSRKIEEIKSIQYGENYLGQAVNRDTPLVWIFIDEAHEFLPRVGKTPATDALVQILREGRQPGISLVLATQQPGKIHTDAITQSDLVISHRLTAKADVEALNEITQSYLYDTISKKLNELPGLKGSAIILDDNSERIYPMRVRPRFTWHGGDAPSAIPKEGEI